MKRKSWICLTLVSLACCNAFALTLNNAVVLSHKEWTTGNIKAVFKEGKQFPMNKIKVQKNSVDVSWASVTSQAVPGKGVAGKKTDVTGGNHFIYIHNGSDTARAYTYLFSDCVGEDQHSTICAFYSEDIKVEPNGYAWGAITSSLAVNLNQSGSYPVEVGSDIDQIDSYTHGIMNRYHSTSFSTLEISDAGSRV